MTVITYWVLIYRGPFLVDYVVCFLICVGLLAVKYSIKVRGVDRAEHDDPERVQDGKTLQDLK
jgi:hypothetical protein